MQEYSRMLIEQYCMTHRKTKKSQFLWDLVELSYNMECEPEEWEALQLKIKTGGSCYEYKYNTSNSK